MNTARSEASSAGRMSDFGLLPIIHVARGIEPVTPSPARDIRRRILLGDDVDFVKAGRRPERVTLASSIVVIALGDENQTMA